MINLYIGRISFSTHICMTSSLKLYVIFNSVTDRYDIKSSGFINQQIKLIMQTTTTSRYYIFQIHKVKIHIQSLIFINIMNCIIMLHIQDDCNTLIKPILCKRHQPYLQSCEKQYFIFKKNLLNQIQWCIILV